MYVCVCRGVTDRDIRKAIREGASSIDEIEQSLGAGTGCGGCRDYTQRLLDDAGDHTAADALAYAAA